MGFFTGFWARSNLRVLLASQSLSGWDGVFHLGRIKTLSDLLADLVAIPFRVGWGFSLPIVTNEPDLFESQSLSGWDGVFHGMAGTQKRVWITLSQSLSGWDGVFHNLAPGQTRRGIKCRNPFQGGMGFFTTRSFA